MSKLTKTNLLEKEVFFFDLDGTLYLGNRLFEGVPEVIELLKEENKKFFFLSNNSSRSTSDYLKKLEKMNLDVSIENIILSQHPTIDYLKENSYKKIFLMGNQSLKKEFENEGFLLTEEEPEILVLAFDTELTYDRLVKASYLLLNNILESHLGPLLSFLSQKPLSYFLYILFRLLSTDVLDLCQQNLYKIQIPYHHSFFRFVQGIQDAPFLLYYVQD